ncbi:MAG TPA: response regulator transcription factor [Terriglobales bacterium]|nr:response regulator transcription factor [Terriglobales bacterium]
MLRDDAQCRIHVLVADSTQLQAQLLASALRRRPEFLVTSCSMEADAILEGLGHAHIEVAVMTAGAALDRSNDFSIIRKVHLLRPETPSVLLVESCDRDTVVDAFRSGVRGLFCYGNTPFRQLCKCIRRVHEGQVWATSEQLQYLLGVFTRVPSLRVLSATGTHLLTDREEQVVALVADGLSNREVARELNLSEHTIKKYLFRIFDKLGVSTRVELALYAVNHGNSREAEWVPGN